MLGHTVSLPPARTRAAFNPVCLHKEYSKAGRTPSSSSSSSSPLPARPEDVVLEVVTLLRKPGDLAELAAYVPDALPAPPGTPVMVAGVPVHEQGPLARCSPFMDTAARRVLPGHLLRRSRILSSLQLGGSALLRVALTACTGEELVLSWRLGLAQLPGTCAVTQLQQQLQAGDQAADSGSSSSSSSSSSSGGGGLLEGNIVGFGPCTSSSSSSSSDGSAGGPQTGNASEAAGLSDAGPPSSSSTSSSTSTPSSSKSCWQVLSCERDASRDAECLPTGPHPRTSPELVVLAQLRALQSRQLMAAATLNMLGRHASGSGWDVHVQAFRHLLEQPHYQPLVNHSRAELGSSALPSQRHFLQEVLLWPDEEGSSSGGGEPARYLFRMGMQSNGSWMTRSIEALL